MAEEVVDPSTGNLRERRLAADVVYAIENCRIIDKSVPPKCHKCISGYVVSNGKTMCLPATTESRKGCKTMDSNGYYCLECLPGYEANSTTMKCKKKNAAKMKNKSKASESKVSQFKSDTH